MAASAKKKMAADSDKSLSDIHSDDDDEQEEEDISWIQWFCSLKGNEFFCEVEEDYIQDDFNLTGLSSQVPYYDYAMDTILDIEISANENLSEEQLDMIESASELLYGLIHARFILTTRGLSRLASPTAPPPAAAPTSRRSHRNQEGGGGERLMFAPCQACPPWSRSSSTWTSAGARGSTARANPACRSGSRTSRGSAPSRYFARCGLHKPLQQLLAIAVPLCGCVCVSDPAALPPDGVPNALACSPFVQRRAPSSPAASAALL